MYTFSERSETNLQTCHQDLQTVMREVIRISQVDFGVVYGHRPIPKQFELFQKGREKRNGAWIVINPKIIVTNIDGYEKKGKHNYNPSEAVDIRIYVPGHSELAYDPEHLTYVAGLVMAVSDQLFREGKIKHRIRWGGNWDGDGIILKDQNLYDRPHYEIIT